MARLVTLAQLRQQAQQRADMENSSFIGTAEWNSMINASAAELYDILVTIYEDYFQASSTFTTASNQDTYPLPATFYKLLGLDQSLGAGQAVECDPFEFAERNSFATFNQAGLTFAVTFVPACPLLVNDTDTFDGVNGWEEYIVIDSAIKALTKEESSTSELMAAKRAIAARIEASAPNRDSGRSGRVTDVHARSPFQQAVTRYRLMGGSIVLKSEQFPMGYYP